MKRKFTLRMILMMVFMVLGMGSAWADEVFGTITDNYMSAKSSSITMYNGGSVHYVFTQETADEAVYQGFVLAVDGRDGTELIRLRQDFWENIAGGNAGCSATYPDGWVTNYHFFNNATVDMTITYNSGTLTMTSTINGSDNGTYSYGYTKAISGSPAGVVVYLGNDHSKITLTESQYFTGTVALTLDHTASSSRNGSNAITTTVDAAAEHYNNTKAAAWGGWAYAQFSFNIPSGESIESATLVWGTVIGGNTNTRNNDIYYVNAGNTINYASLTSSTNLNMTDGATLIASVPLQAPAAHKDVSTDVTQALRTISSSQNYIIFEWTNNPAGADLYGKASAYAPTLIITTTSVSLHNVSFVETNGVEATITMDNEDVTAGTALADGSYSFKATAAGYYDYEGTFEVSGEAKTVEFTMTEKPKFTYTVNAVDEDGNLLQALVSKTAYEGETATMAWSKYIKVGDVWYVTDETPFVASSTESGEKNVVYKPSEIFYFVECENMNGVRTDRDATEVGGSNNVYIRISKYSKDYYTDYFAEGGLFDIAIPYYNSNDGTEDYKIQLTADGKAFTDTGLTLTCAAKGSGSMTQTGIVVPAGYAIAISYSGTGNALARMDYLTLTRSQISQSISSVGWATLYTPYALSFAGTGLTAYTATVANGQVTLAEVSDVPANTGVVLQGEAGSYLISSIASSTTAQGELQGSATEALAYDENAENDYYMLAHNSETGKVQFTKLTSGSIAAGKAYLVQAKGNGARTLNVVFAEDGTNGIQTLDKTPQADGACYNLNGQRVSQPAKGLYIVNGKKVVIK